MLSFKSSKTSEASRLYLEPLSAVARPAPETAREGNEMWGWDHYSETISSCHWAKACYIDMGLCHPVADIILHLCLLSSPPPRTAGSMVICNALQSLPTEISQYLPSSLSYRTELLQSGEYPPNYSITLGSCLQSTKWHLYRSTQRKPQVPFPGTESPEGGVVS